MMDLTCMYVLTGQEDKDPAFQTICSVLQHASDTSNRSQVTQAHALLDKIMDPIWFRDKCTNKTNDEPQCTGQVFQTRTKKSLREI